MIDLPAPRLTEHELVLDPADPVRGDDSAASECGMPPLAGRIALGGPEARVITPAFLAGDPELRTYVTEHAHQYLYYLVDLSVSFVPGPTHPRLISATIGLQLSSTAGTSEPIALSMSPYRVSDISQIQKSWRLGPQLSLLGADASIGEIGRTTSHAEQQVFLQALRPLRSDPAWEFRRTRTNELEGSHLLRLVVRAAYGTATGISCAVTARAKTPLLRRFRKELPNPLRLETVL